MMQLLSKGVKKKNKKMKKLPTEKLKTNSAKNIKSKEEKQNIVYRLLRFIDVDDTRTNGSNYGRIRY